MLRTLFIGIFLSLYIVVVGIPLLIYTVICKNPDALYWAGLHGVMFFVRAAGVRVRVTGLERSSSPLTVQSTTRQLPALRRPLLRCARASRS
jgi:hypothetical protein